MKPRLLVIHEPDKDGQRALCGRPVPRSNYRPEQAGGGMVVVHCQACTLLALGMEPLPA